MEQVQVSGAVQAPRQAPNTTSILNFHIYAILEENINGQWIVIDSLRIVDGVQDHVPGNPGGPGGGVNDPPPALVGSAFDPLVLESVQITGPTSVNDSAATPFVATATARNSQGTKTAVVTTLAQWHVSPAPPFSVDASGVLQPAKIVSDTVATLTADFTLGGITRTSAALPVTVHATGKLLNLSTRLRVQNGDSVLIAGMIATGSANKKVAVRALGPSLVAFGLTGVLANPTLELFQGDTKVASNDDWRVSAQQAEIANAGLAPSNDAESALIATLTPNLTYTAIVRSKDGQPGIGVVEAYDLDQAASSKLANISTRGFVDVDDKVMFAGVIVGPPSTGGAKVLVRALGPSLGDLGVTGFLADPTLDLADGNGTVIRSNDSWQSSQADLIPPSLQPGHVEEAALVQTLTPGQYTAVVRGKNGATGVGLVEVFNIP
jgi:hypothetical protein